MTLSRKFAHLSSVKGTIVTSQSSKLAEQVMRLLNSLNTERCCSYSLFARATLREQHVPHQKLCLQLKRL